MSKYESSLIGDFEQILEHIEGSILGSGLGEAGFTFAFCPTTI